MAQRQLTHSSLYELYAYKPTEESLRPLYYALDLKEDPDLIARYRAWHAPDAVPEAVTKSLRDAGIDALEIYLVGNRMIMALTPGPEFDAAKKAEADLGNPEVQAWEALMWQFQQALSPNRVRNGRRWRKSTPWPISPD